MGSLFLSKLTSQQRDELTAKLLEAQSGNCFICEKQVDLHLHKDNIDLDHVIPLKNEGKDNESNLAVTHDSCNRSKQASNLEVARILHRFGDLRESLQGENRSPNLGDVLAREGGGGKQLKFELNSDDLLYSLSEVGDQSLYKVPVYKDELSGFRYFFTKLPIDYLAHDDRINPRSIGANISKLVEEFHNKRPQLHVPLAWISSTDGKSAVHIFDGQHKAAAQILLGVRALPVRVFIDPHPDTLITTNTNAGTTLKQVAFDKSVQRHLGSTLYSQRLERHRTERGLSEDDLSFSERDLVKYFKGQSREMKRYIIDAVRDAITSSPENKLRDYIDYGGRGRERPLSYSSIDKTFYSFFVYNEVLDTPLNFGAETGENPRELEVSQLIQLANIIAEEIYVNKFDPDIGTDKVESRLQKGETFQHSHLRAVRMSREEILYNWLKYVHQIAKFYFINTGVPVQEEKLFHYMFPEQLWENIRHFVRNLADLPLWVNSDLSATVFGAKQNYQFWQTIFESGKTPQGTHVLPSGINLIEMIK